MFLNGAFAIFPHVEPEDTFKKLFYRMLGVGFIAVSPGPESAKRALRMQRVNIHRFWRSGIRAIPGILLVGLVTFICYGLGLNCSSSEPLTTNAADASAASIPSPTVRAPAVYAASATGR